MNALWIIPGVIVVAVGILVFAIKLTGKGRW